MNTTSLTPSGFLYTGTPVFYSPGLTSAPSTGRGIAVSIARGGKKIFRASGLGDIRLNVADICRDYALMLPEVSPLQNGTDWIISVLDSDAIDAARCTVDNQDGDDARYFVPLTGKISSSTLEALPGQSDIFTERFLSSRRNFFFTVRTADSLLRIPEAQLYPLYFLNDDVDCTVGAVDAATGKKVEDVLCPEGFCALDIDALRRRFFDVHGVIPSLLIVYRNGIAACRIAVERSHAAVESYRLCFRNSLGAFEVLSLIGEMSVNHESESSENIYECYRPDFDDFEKKTQQSQRKESLVINACQVSRNDITMLAELLRSDDVWLIDFEGKPVRVLPQAENFNHSKRLTAPLSLNITLQLSVADRIDHLSVSSIGSRIFSDKFSEQFN